MLVSKNQHPEIKQIRQILKTVQPYIDRVIPTAELRKLDNQTQELYFSCNTIDYAVLAVYNLIMAIERAKYHRRSMFNTDVSDCVSHVIIAAYQYWRCNDAMNSSNASTQSDELLKHLIKHGVKLFKTNI